MEELSKTRSITSIKTRNALLATTFWNTPTTTNRIAKSLAAFSKDYPAKAQPKKIRIVRKRKSRAKLKINA